MSMKLHTLLINTMNTDNNYQLLSNNNCVLKLHVFWSLCKMWPQNSALHILFDLKMLIDSQTGSFVISQYVGLEFVRTQLNLCVLLIKRLAYICLLMAAGIKWRCSNLQIKMYENISDRPISGLLGIGAKATKESLARGAILGGTTIISFSASQPLKDE